MHRRTADRRPSFGWLARFGSRAAAEHDLGDRAGATHEHRKRDDGPVRTRFEIVSVDPVPRPGTAVPDIARADQIQIELCKVAREALASSFVDLCGDLVER